MNLSVQFGHAECISCGGAYFEDNVTKINLGMTPLMFSKPIAMHRCVCLPWLMAHRSSMAAFNSQSRLAIPCKNNPVALLGTADRKTNPILIFCCNIID
jgi:hypothetical protein